MVSCLQRIYFSGRSNSRRQFLKRQRFDPTCDRCLGDSVETCCSQFFPSRFQLSSVPSEERPCILFVGLLVSVNMKRNKQAEVSKNQSKHQVGIIYNSRVNSVQSYHYYYFVRFIRYQAFQEMWNWMGRSPTGFKEMKHL